MSHFYNPTLVEPPEDEEYLGECPCCGTELSWSDEVYTSDTDGSIVGCQYCMSRKDAGDVFDDYSRL